MEKLLALKSLIDINKKEQSKYIIPKKWNKINYKKFENVNEHEIKINPWDFFNSCIDYCINYKTTDNTKHRKIYSMMIRTQTAYNHDKENIEQGTYLKAIAMIPYLKSLNINTIYLLPVFQYSDAYKKGSIGSIYAVKDFYALEPRDHDPLLGEFDSDKLELQFAAFVEACHLMGIKVMVDFIFRTCARDNILLNSHPDWFYYIHKQYENDFCLPKIEALGEVAQPIRENTEKVYRQGDIIEYIDKFCDAPQKVEGEKDYFNYINEQLNITTAPAFSDCINDFQPIWSDVTYLKLDLEHSQLSKEFGFDHKPYFILPDSIKLSNHEVSRPNFELWDYLANIIPHYIKKFDIDGARIDMGHALPKLLLKQIIRNAKKQKQEFLFWNEELFAANSAIAKNDGADFISGSTWNDFTRFSDKSFNKWFLSSQIKSELDCTCALEFADTPRAAAVFKDIKLIKNLFVFSVFLPNSIPFINSGFELNEIQPMNLGLGKSKQGRFALSDDDPMQGKLAFFDIYRLHWNNQNGETFKLISETLALRDELSEIVFSEYKSALIDENIDEFLTAYSFNFNRRHLLVIFNRNERYSRRIDLKDYFNITDTAKIRIRFDGDKICNRQNKKNVFLAPPHTLMLFEINN